MLRTKVCFIPDESQRERDHREIAYRAALESIVLLENDGTLPLAPGRIALYGAGAGRTIKGGTGSGEVNERFSVTICEGLQQAGFEIASTAWLDDYERDFNAAVQAHQARIRRRIGLFNIAALARIMSDAFIYPAGRAVTEQDLQASATDTCFYVLARQSGEAADRRLDQDEFSLSAVERENIVRCARFYRRTIVVINAGSSFDVSFMREIPGLSSLVFFGQQGAAGGTAFADLVTGRVAPSGKLTDTWYRTYDDVPFGREFSYMASDPDNAEYKEDIYVGYRYCDTFRVEPAHPFGFGLSYTPFAINCMEVRVEGTRLRLRVAVRNRGDRFAGKEVVQLYASCPQTEMGKEYQRLVAFMKTAELQPGAAEERWLEADLAACASFQEVDATTRLDAGDYIFRLGNSSRSTVPVAVVRLDAPVTLARHARICPPQHAFERLKPEDVAYADDLSQVVRLTARAANFETVVHAYGTPPACDDESARELLGRLTLRDQMDLVVGSGMMDVLFSRNWFNCPGAVGNTTSRLIRKGIINVTLADGPAGLRLQKRSAVRHRAVTAPPSADEGPTRIRMVDAQIEFFNYLPNFIKAFLFGRENRDPLAYQYTTALPVGLALAQTWNETLLEEVGRLVGLEMHEYGVTWWLAPGINIHRNPLCGRNFEYFSEDPLLTGRLAAAIIQGCQGCGGVFVAVKHFCCNNQEENRTRVSSHVSERALREIYLPGFEMAVRDGGAGSVMTSYNRVNGVYTANSHDLCTKVLRNEWGFEGAVMTDWFATGRKLADSAWCLKAGNDLVMPGSRYDRLRIQRALRKGEITVEDVRRCAANVLCVIMNSQLAEEYPPGSCGLPQRGGTP